jgi:methylenetetrahydrofolate reductase (NADPH)
VNAAKSDDTKYGWGPSNGRIYQKAYFELFVHQDILKKLINFLE